MSTFNKAVYYYNFYSTSFAIKHNNVCLYPNKLPSTYVATHSALPPIPKSCKRAVKPAELGTIFIRREIMTRNRLKRLRADGAICYVGQLFLFSKIVEIYVFLVSVYRRLYLTKSRAPYTKSNYSKREHYSLRHQLVYLVIKWSSRYLYPAGQRPLYTW